MTLAKGRLTPPPVEFTVRAITRDDLPRLAQPRDKTATYPQRLRESHHRIAEYVAAGFDLTAVAMLTGYSFNRVSQLCQSPAMVELIAILRESMTGRRLEVVDAFRDLEANNLLVAERQIADHLAEADERGELLSIGELEKLAKSRADRIYGKKSTNLNINVDFAARLEAAIQRSGNAQAALGPPSRSATPAQLPRLRRIA